MMNTGRLGVLENICPIANAIRNTQPNDFTKAKSGPNLVTAFTSEFRTIHSFFKQISFVCVSLTHTQRSKLG